MKKRHDWDDDHEDNLPNMDIHQVTTARNQKRIRIEGSSSQNKRITFNDNGEEQEERQLQSMAIRISLRVKLPRPMKTIYVVSRNVSVQRRILIDLKSRNVFVRSIRNKR